MKLTKKHAEADDSIFMFKLRHLVWEDGDLVSNPVSVANSNPRASVFEIRYQSDNLEIDGFLLVPTADPPAGSEGYPCVIYNRGGNNLGDRDPGRLNHEHGHFSNLTSLAAAGYVIVASQYRGLGPDAPWGANGDHFGGDDVNDVLNLIPLLES